MSSLFREFSRFLLLCNSCSIIRQLDIEMRMYLLCNLYDFFNLRNTFSTSRFRDSFFH